METHPTVVKPKTVLVVEDEPVLRMIALDYLASVGFETVEAHSADEALALLERQPAVTALFTDVQMPGSMDGIDLAAIATRRWPSILIIVTSGARQSSQRPLPERVTFLPKPYHLPAIAGLVAAA